MFSHSELIFGNIIPPLLGLVVFLIAARPWRRGDIKHGAWGGPIAIGVTALAAIAPVIGVTPAWKPIQADHWMYYLIAAAIVVGLFQAIVKPKFWITLILVLLLSGWTAFCMVPSGTRDAWETRNAITYVAAVAGAITVWWLMTELLVRRASPRWAAFLLGLLAGGSGLVLLMTLSVASGRYGATIATAVAAALLITLISPKLDLSHGTVIVLITPFAAQLVTGYFRAPDEKPLTFAMLGLLFVAPILAWVISLTRLLKPKVRWIGVTLGLFIPIAIAVGLAAPKFIKSIDESSQDEYGSYR